MSDELQSPFRPGENCWRIEKAERFAVIVDADDYFRDVRDAMMAAEKQITIVGWDFDPRIKLDPDKSGNGVPNTLGAFIPWLANRKPDLCIRILIWNMGAFKLLLRGAAVLTILRWKMHSNVTLRFDSQHPIGATHHQKIIAIDDSLAFCGGIDMTVDRWDTSDHADHDPRRRGPLGFPYPPWHDVTAAVNGPAAVALAELCRDRWVASGGEPIEPVPDPEPGRWIEGLPALMTDTTVAIARTRPAGGAEEVREIEAMFLDLIGRAKRFVYADNQYFASRRIAEAIAKRLAEPGGPEVVLVNPESADGWLQEQAMGTARAELMRALAEIDVEKRFRIYTPVTPAGVPIYVHAKVMIVDDLVLQVGSANMNNRSMGLDSECDVAVSGDEPAIRALRERLMAEHLGVEPAEVARVMAETGSLIATVEALRGEGKTLVPFEPPALSGFARALGASELLDPESAEERFEPLSKRGLFRRRAWWRQLHRWRQERKARRPLRTAARRFLGRR
ncbi:phospholipase D-like domain-containing protein [Sphingomonas sp. ID0503]|uniref:phospholipase D-like domain-containing protein n=1 Tax=Sphingomonas sp. ID0503 TaxID=3399691 RepID=UPI003AFB5265